MLNKNLVIKNLSKIYKNGVIANNNISIEFKTHNITALIGHNGAGKTTLLNQIGGLTLPTAGEIYMDGINLVKEHTKVKTIVSSMPQFQVPLKGVTLFQAITSIAMIKGFSRKEAKDMAEELISYLQLEKWKNISGENLSGGLQRLTSFAMTVIDKAPIIVLDEPTNDVDPIRRILMWKYLKQLADEGSVVLIVTHNLLEVEKYADRYVLLEKGKLKEDVEISSEYSSNVNHILSIYDIDFEDIKFFADFKSKYDKSQRKLIVKLKETELNDCFNVLLNILNEGKATNYEMKIENLYDEYEDMTNENN